jgi:hypothetical protein
MLMIIIFLICVGVFSLCSLIAILLIYIDEKRLDHSTDFLTRLNNGEVLSSKNIFNNS